MISRTAFTQLGHSTWLLAATVLGMLIVYAAPPVLAIRGNFFGVVAWVLMAGLFVPTVRLYRLSPLWALLLPATALFYLGATIHSAIQYWRGRGWRVEGSRTRPVMIGDVDQERYGRLLAEFRPGVIESPEEHERLLGIAEQLLDIAGDDGEALDRSSAKF